MTAVDNGVWETKSEKDPRWNMTGKGVIATTGHCLEAHLAIQAKAIELSEYPPADLKISTERELALKK